ncbi:uncharacterized protein LOC110177271 [Drosophila serrata]|uniref:uncharacterized protein LOC110177271 n=1 Tax=Drosophila serrata TaxID=7274 RepID=UPI000A1D019A|nr:uncharacterized protein LOC110177271 [Drosophila serrata]
MPKALSPQSMAQSPQMETFNVTQVSTSALGRGRGVQLPPLLAKGHIQPEQLANVRFRLVEVDTQPLSDRQFNALIKRLVKCFMAEVEITKRLRKISSQKSVLPANMQLIRHMEGLRRSYETERSGLVTKLSRDCRFRPYATITAHSTESESNTSCKARKSKSLEILSKGSEGSEKTADSDASTSRQRQSGGVEPIICNRIEPPAGLCKRLREKLYRLQEIAKAQIESSSSDESLNTSTTLSSFDLFYDMKNF